jgi:4-oxalomesaconate tautomerase
VFGAVSVATACLVPGSVAFELADGEVNDHGVLDVEHPTGYFSVTLDVTVNAGDVVVNYAALLRTARLLMRGDVFVPSAVWPDA